MGNCLGNRVEHRRRNKASYKSADKKEALKVEDVVAHAKQIEEIGSKISHKSLVVRGYAFWDTCFQCQQKFASCLFKQHYEFCSARQVLKAKESELGEIKEQDELKQLSKVLEAEAAELQAKADALLLVYNSKLAIAVEVDKKMATRLQEYTNNKLKGFKMKYDEIQSFKAGEIEQRHECLICLQNFKLGEVTIVLPCLHIYHKGCLDRWFKKTGKKECLMDKYQLL